MITNYIPDTFVINTDELQLRFSHGTGRRELSFATSQTTPAIWKEKCKSKLGDCLGLHLPASFEKVKEVRSLQFDQFEIKALIMQVDETLSIPAYLCLPNSPAHIEQVVIAIHGHGEVEPLLGQRDDYHHSFAIALVKAGHIVLCPELRGFGTLYRISQHHSESRMDYWKWGNPMSFSLATDAFQHGRTMLGETIEDLLRWEQWLKQERSVRIVNVAGISYGGDLAIAYPVFSDCVGRIFASGTMGSFSTIFTQARNAPAHCIPDILNWMDRSDIAGLNAPRPILLHYGELDTPGPENTSASNNASVPGSIDELKAIYAAFEHEDHVYCHISPGMKHEMDIPVLLEFLQ